MVQLPLYVAARSGQYTLLIYQLGNNVNATQTYNLFKCNTAEGTTTSGTINLVTPNNGSSGNRILF